MRKKELETQKEFNKTIAEFAEHQKNANENFKGLSEFLKNKTNLTNKLRKVYTN